MCALENLQKCRREAPPSVLPDISPAWGEITLAAVSPSLQRLQEWLNGAAFNIPLCGGDVRQDRGGRLAPTALNLNPQIPIVHAARRRAKAGH